MGEYEMTYEKIADTIPKVRIDPNGRQIEATCLRGRWSHYPDMIRKPEGMVVLENFPAGETARWTFWYDEVHYILDGEAELTYLLPATRFSVAKKMKVEKGDAYLIPKGAECTWQVAPGGPLKHFCVIMPGPEPYRPELMPPEARGSIAS